MGSWGEYFILVTILLFAYSSILENYVYAEANLLYLEEDGKFIRFLQFIALIMAFLGSVMDLELVWSLVDVGMILVITLNLFAIF